jgi:hypothetical protein
VQTVSGTFKSTAVGATITPVRSVQIALIDNLSIGASITPSATSNDPSYFPATKAVNGIVGPPQKWAYADAFAEGAGGRCLADGTWYPYDIYSEGGYWGSTLSDGSSNIGGGGEVFTITYSTAITLQQVAFWANAYLNIPVNFVVAYDPTGASGFTTITTVTGNTAANWIYTLPVTVTCKILKITITKIDQPSMYCNLIEFQGGLVVDVTSQVKKIDVLQERYADNATLEVGNSSVGELSLELDNTGSLWGPHSASAYAPYLRSNRRVTVQVGFQYSPGSTELVPLGAFYTMAWSAPGGGPTAFLKAQDRAKKLRERKYRNSPLMVSQTVDVCIQQALIDAGLGANDYVLATSATVIPYAWATPDQNFFNYIAELAAADGGVVFFDENDVLHFQDANYLHNNSTTSLLTITDSIALISNADEWNEGDVKNRVAVSVNALKLAASATIWSLQETITVPAGGTYTVYITYQYPATNVSVPSITAGPNITVTGWTPYAMGGKLILTNSAGADQTCTAITVTGQTIQSDGSNIVIAEAASVTSGAEAPRELAISNAFIQTISAATTLANNLLNLYANPPAKLTIEAVGLPHVELGDRITVNSAIAGINSDFWVIRHQFTDDGGLHSSLGMIAVV